MPFIAGEKKLIFHEGDAVGLHDIISSVINDDEKLKEIAEYGYERCMNNFTVEALNKKFYNLLCEVVKGEKNDI